MYKQIILSFFSVKPNFSYMRSEVTDFHLLNMPLRHALLALFLPSAQTMHESLFTGYFLFQFVLKSS